MRTMIRRISLLAMALIVVMGMTAAAFADSKVIYQDKAEEFIFVPGSDYSPTDLFTEFKGVMPGDSLTQTIEIKNEDSGKDKVRIYIKALGTSAGSGEFLSQLTMTVTAADGNKTLFEAPADETAQLTEWVCLGTFESGADLLMEVTLNVPLTMGNEFQEQMGSLDWKFKAERIPAPETPPVKEDSSGNDDVTEETGRAGTSDDESGSGDDITDREDAAQTGDDRSMTLPLIFGGAALAVLIVLFITRRKK